MNVCPVCDGESADCFLCDGTGQICAGCGEAENSCQCDESDDVDCDESDEAEPID